MPDYNAHIGQANVNLNLIERLIDDDYWDWKVTIAFYAALHIINAHIARISDLHYRKHIDTLNAIDPAFNKPTKTDSDTHIAYRTLQNLSRRARYLTGANTGSSGAPKFTNEKHFAKAMRHLNTIIAYFDNIYSDFSVYKISVRCSEISNPQSLSHIKVVR